MPHADSIAVASPPSHPAHDAAAAAASREQDVGIDQAQSELGQMYRHPAHTGTRTRIELQLHETLR